jgi:CheY-like chemotaxis protein
MFSSATILLVDDNEDDIFIMRNTFKKAAVANPVRTAVDGEEAIAYLQGTGKFADREKFPLPLVIFLDVNMPRKNGLEVLRWIREQPDLKKLTVHILSASSRPEDVQAAAQLNANSYLVKPSKLEEMLVMVKSWYALTHFAAFSLIN